MRNVIGRRNVSASALCTIIILATPVYSENMAAESLAKLGVVFTTNAARMLRDASTDHKPPETKLAAARKILDQQRVRETNQASAIAIGDATMRVALSATTVSLASTGIGAPAAVAFHLVASAALDAGVGAIDLKAREAVTKAAALNKAEILSLAGGGNVSFENIPLEELKQRLEGATGFIQDLNRGLPADASSTRAYLADIAVDVLRNTTIEALDEIARQGVEIDTITQDVVDIQAGLAAHKSKTEALITAQEKAIGDVDVAINNLTQSVDAIDARLAAQDHNQTYVNDFILSTMPPAAKVAALKNGFMGERFECPQGEDECDGSKARDDLIRQFEAEATFQNQTEKLGEIAQGLNDITVIADALGVELPEEFRDVSGAAGVGMQAFNHFASGNYLGAVASLTGLMGGGGDADQARHEAMMNYLAVEFGQINQRLTTIDTKLAEMDAKLDAIALQMERYYQNIDAKLDTLNWKLDQAINLLQFTYWQPWGACNAMISRLGRRYIDDTALGPVLTPDTNIFEVQSIVGQDALLCRNHASAEIRSLQQVDFGNFLNAQFAMGKITADGTESAPLDMKTFVENVYAPSYNRLMLKVANDSISLPSVFDLLAYPADTLSELRTTYSDSTAGRWCVRGGAWEAGGWSSQSVHWLLCEVGGGDSSPDIIASKLLQSPMLTKEALTITGYIRILAPMIDLFDQSRSNWVRPEDLDRYIGSLGNRPVEGEALIAATIGMLDAVIASYNLRSGGLTASSFAEFLRSPPESEPQLEADRQNKLDQAHFIMHVNPVLARNTVLVLLSEAYGVRNGSGEIVSREVRTKTYRDALSYAERHPERPELYLNGIFGNNFSFTVEDGVVSVLLSSRAGSTLPEALRRDLPQEIRIAMPEPNRLKEGRLHYSYRMNELIAARVDLQERLFGYEVYDTLTVDEREAVLEGVGR